MAQFTTPGFYLPVEPQDHWSEWINAKKTSRDTVSAWRDTVMEGRGEGGSALCWGDRENPREVPVWRENHVKTTDGSLRELCKEGKKQMTKHTEHVCPKAFEGISLDSSPFFPTKSLTVFKGSHWFQRSEDELILREPTGLWSQDPLLLKDQI